MIIRERRKALGLTQKELASRIGIADVNISNWEREIEEVPPGRLAALAAALEFDINELFGGRRPIRDADGTLFEWLLRVAKSDLTIEAKAILSGLVVDREMVQDRGDGLEYSGSLERIAMSFRNVSLEMVEAVWTEVWDRGFIEDVGQDTRWHVAFVLQD